MEKYSDPEPRVFETVGAQRKVWERSARSARVRSAGSGADGGDAAEDLRADEGECDVESGQSLEQDHAEADALDGIEHAEPEPQSAAGQGTCEGGASPGNPKPNARGCPENLAPAGGSKADGEHGEDPGVALREGGEAPEEESPEEDEEAEDEEDDRPGWGVVGGPKVAPIAPVRGREKVILNQDSNEEPLGTIPSALWQ